MRALRRIRIVVEVAILFAISIGIAPSAFAQIGGAPGPPIAPLAPPPPPPNAAPAAAPGAPAAVATTSALPALAPAPSIVQASPSASVRAFRCSCFGTGLGTQWVGVVQAPSYALADQAAQGQCVAFKLNANPGSPYIPQSAFGFSRNPYPAVNPNIAPGNVVSQSSSATIATTVQSTQRLSFAGRCARCACN